MAGNRQRWADIPLEKKLGLVLVPLAAALIGAGVPLFSGDEKAPPVSAGELKRPQLEVIDLAPTGYGTVDLTLVNSGSLVAVAKRIGFRISETVRLRNCGRRHHRPQGLRWRTSAYRVQYRVPPVQRALPPSGRYSLKLPARPRSGAEVAKKVSQALAPGASDRFTVRLAPPRDGLWLYRLQVRLYHDKARRPKEVGNVLVSLPAVRILGYLQDSASQPCTRDNESRLRRVLKPDTVAPPEIANLLAAR